ncbi:hypothetical protein TRM7557_00272 [Tritonibacter multivorans]|uniref:Uncharacterized protein n=1 Tax=Tritonibacter multivorans TaxID=928856 RepID=A0A0P1G0I0_9RHOB|nr:hypothetical protein [Tritonibacter multivorans]CUH75211.1 hypothetical protein TRM7557_00272 [Tritonibacter multivorans]SFD22699.1 hypothetical protein SAMN04488049_10989 [Tritonibacter multivorans]
MSGASGGDIWKKMKACALFIAAAIAFEGRCAGVFIFSKISPPEALSFCLAMPSVAGAPHGGVRLFFCGWHRLFPS